jgi:hypothetical protein
MSSEPGGHGARPAEGVGTAAWPTRPTVKVGAAIGSNRSGSERALAAARAAGSSPRTGDGEIPAPSARFI